MAYKQVGIIKKNWRDIKPPLGSVIDYSNPLSKGLVGAWLMNEGAGLSAVDLVRKNNASLTSPIWRPSRDGVSLNFNGSSTVGDCGTKVPLVEGDFTIVTKGIVTAGVNSSHCFISRGNTPVTRLWELKIRGSPEANTGVVVFDLYDGTNNPSVVGAVDERGVLRSWAAVKQPGGAGGLSIYRDGKLYVNTPTYTLGSYNNVADNVLIGKRTDYSTAWFNGTIYYVYLYSRALSPSEIQSLYIAPYQMIAPIVRRTYIQVGGEPPPVTNRLTRRRVILSCN